MRKRSVINYTTTLEQSNTVHGKCYTVFLVTVGDHFLLLRFEVFQVFFYSHLDATGYRLERVAT